MPLALVDYGDLLSYSSEIPAIKPEFFFSFTLSLLVRLWLLMFFPSVLRGSGSFLFQFHPAGKHSDFVFKESKSWASLLAVPFPHPIEKIAYRKKLTIDSIDRKANEMTYIE